MEKLLQLIGQAIAENSADKHWFFNYSGHTGTVDISIWIGGWLFQGKPTAKFYAYTDNPENFDKACQFVKDNLNLENKL